VIVGGHNPYDPPGLAGDDLSTEQGTAAALEGIEIRVNGIHPVVEAAALFCSSLLYILCLLRSAAVYSCLKPSTAARNCLQPSMPILFQHPVRFNRSMGSGLIRIHRQLLSSMEFLQMADIIPAQLYLVPL